MQDEDRSYFFDTGIRFACLRCGACCTGAPGTIYVAPNEIVSLAHTLSMSAADFMARYLYPYKDSFSIREDARGRCLFYDEGCTVYEARPLQCRTFPFWFDNVRSESRWRQIREHCPGIGRGRLFTKSEIIRLAGQTTMI